MSEDLKYFYYRYYAAFAIFTIFISFLMKFSGGERVSDIAGLVLSLGIYQLLRSFMVHRTKPSTELDSLVESLALVHPHAMRCVLDSERKGAKKKFAYEYVRNKVET